MMRIELQPGEHILRQALANHYEEVFMHIGKLFLTNMRVVFVSHPLNFRNYTVSMPLSEIHHVRVGKNLGFFMYGIIIEMANEKKEHFSVWRRYAWEKDITETKKGLLKQATVQSM